MSKIQLGSQGRKTSFGRKERRTYSPYKEKAEKYKKILRKSGHVWLSGRLHIEGRLNQGPRLQRKHKDENEATQNQHNTRERRHDIYLQTKRPEGTSSRHLWLVDKGERTSTSPLALGYPLLGYLGSSMMVLHAHTNTPKPGFGGRGCEVFTVCMYVWPSHTLYI